MRAGELDRLITIQADTGTTQNTYGEPIPNWTTLAQVWAKVDELAGVEVLTGDQMASIETTRFRIYYRSDVTAKNRITFNGNTYNIKAVIEIGRREGLDIRAVVIDP